MNLEGIINPDRHKGYHWKENTCLEAPVPIPNGGGGLLEYTLRPALAGQVLSGVSGLTNNQVPKDYNQQLNLHLETDSQVLDIAHYS